MKFFHNISTLEELKKAYRKLALIHHPDRGGHEKDFIALKDEYDLLFKRLNKQESYNKYQKQHDQTKEKHDQRYYEQENNFKEIIDELINYDIDLEIIGHWIWVSGNTFPIKDILKRLNFKFSSKKKAWYFHEGEYVKNHKKSFTLDEIRNMHNTKKYKTNSKTALNG